MFRVFGIPITSCYKFQNCDKQDVFVVQCLHQKHEVFLLWIRKDDVFVFSELMFSYFRNFDNFITCYYRNCENTMFSSLISDNMKFLFFGTEKMKFSYFQNSDKTLSYSYPNFENNKFFSSLISKNMKFFFHEKMMFSYFRNSDNFVL